MRNNFEVSAATLSTEPKSSLPGDSGWRSVLLGAAVGIAGPAYFGTLFSNLTLWVLIGQGLSTQQAYAYLFQFNFSFPVVAHLVADACFAFACGWVSAAYGRGSAISQGIWAGLLSASFPTIMLLSPNSGEMPILFRVISLALPLLGSVVGAYTYARKT